VRFLNQDEERQYLAQSPPSNTLLPRDHESGPFTSTTGEDTPRQATSSIPHSKESWDTSAGEDVDPGGEWVDDPLPEDTPHGENSRDGGGSRDDWMDGMIAGVQKINVQRPPA